LTIQTGHSADSESDQLVEMVEEILGVYDLDFSSNFIEEGGHSLLAIELEARVYQVWQRHLDFPTLYNSTLGEVAADLFR
jgi:Phosphopantetheine attachment site